MDKLKKSMRDFGVRLLVGLRSRWWYMLIIAAVIGIDQATKWIAVACLKGKPSVDFIKGIIAWDYMENDGAAYGMFANNRWIFMVASVVGIVAFFLYLYGKRDRNMVLDIGLIFVIGGGVGNMIDRTFLNYVIDFMKVTVGTFLVDLLEQLEARVWAPVASVLDFVGNVLEKIPLLDFTNNVADDFVCVGGAMVFVALTIQIIREEVEKKRAAKAAALADKENTSAHMEDDAS